MKWAWQESREDNKTESKYGRDVAFFALQRNGVDSTSVDQQLLSNRSSQGRARSQRTSRKYLATYVQVSERHGPMHRGA